jgi:hypothetical protein
MRHLARRLARLETHVDRHEDRLPWAEVHAALSRQQARVRLALCQRLGVDAGDPRVVEAMTWLVGDDPVRVAQDAEILARWRRVHGRREAPEEVRQRLAQRLEAMARRAAGVRRPEAT